MERDTRRQTMAKRRRVLTPPEVRRLEEHGERCQSRHPNWNGVRCERADSGFSMTPHITHHAEGRRFEWDDQRTAF